MEHQAELRDSLVEYLRHELVGPDPATGGATERLQESPRQRYSAGVLFPSNQPFIELEDARLDEVAPEEQPDEAPPPGIDEQVSEPKRSGGREESNDAEYDEMIRLTNAFFPSALGLTFICDSARKGLRVEARAAVYHSEAPTADDSKLRQWVRNELDIKPVDVQMDVSRSRASQRRLLAENLVLYVIHRRRHDGSCMVTMSLINAKTSKGGGPPSGSDCFYQVGFVVRDPDGLAIFREYSAGVRSVTDQEEASLQLLYRSRRAYAVGHGCAADWDGEIDAHVKEVSTSAVPAFTLAPIEPRTSGGDELSMHFLSGARSERGGKEIPDVLESLASDYEAWIAAREGESRSLPESLRPAGAAHLAECRTCLDRMRAGIQLLRSNDDARRAFMLANMAMLMQQHHSRRSRRLVDAEWKPLPSDYAPPDSRSGRWRCFQLAFILMNLKSLLPDGASASSEERDVVDLIWFPTGGGKTEAYLGLAAYTIFLRRIHDRCNTGCTVLMRYTLRLLTAQQFQRASALICACEVIRQQNPDLLGSEEQRITIGLWVGQSLSPNTRDEAIRTANALARRERDVENPFQILTCPWCGTAMDDAKNLGYVPITSPRMIQLRCPDSRCPFSKRSFPLPIQVVDEDIYDAPPALVIGTVDKFAMLAWREHAGSIFGLDSHQRHDPPDLIIQDELHLIAGPLGSVVGLYECVIDLLCSWRGRRPKIVASTATIRRAGQQCRALYNRDVFQFPPPGLDISDSFFACENPRATGRTYVGVFATAAPSFVTALVRTASALLQGCRGLPLPDGADESIRDPYWTLVQYFSSLRELGHAATLVEADIPEYMWAIASRSRIPKELCRTIGAPIELTSRRSAQEIPEILERLKITYPRQSKDSPRPVDTLLATNMISVGVDVDRLGLMMIVGQPKTSSEYIQASSRVGRSQQSPGLIITMFNSAKPRDRSHLEHFRAYHQAFYRHVEPTSVTPFSIPVIERALHAVLVIAARHLGGVQNPDQFTPDISSVERLRVFLERRTGEVDAEHMPLMRNRLRELIDRWAAVRPSGWGRFGPPPEPRPLMYPAGSEPREEWDGLAWPTPSSMRSVDVECEAQVLGLYRTS